MRLVGPASIGLGPHVNSGTALLSTQKTNTAFVVGIFSPEDILKETANNHIETVASALIASGV